MNILSFGSMNIDYVYQVPHMVRPGETLDSFGMETFVGGKGLNQSVALSKAGLSVCHAGMVGEDGEILLHALTQNGVDTRFVMQREGKSGHTIIQVDESGQNSILLYGGANRSLTEEEIDEVLSHFSKGDFLILQNELNLLPKLVEKGWEKGLTVVLNPSPLNEVIGQCDLKYVSVLLINEIEGKELSGEDDPEAILDVLLKRYPHLKIVLTLGSLGAEYADASLRLHQDIFPVKTVDTTGAGDTFTGYFIHGLANGVPMEETLRRCAMASALAVSRKGASPSIPYMEEVLRALQEQ